MSKVPSRLVAVHNLSEVGFRHAADLGGLACPSLAVVRNDVGLDNFGEITLIAPPSLVHPRKVKVFDADVYSPRQPRANYEVDSTELREVIASLEERYLDDERLPGIKDYAYQDKLINGGVDDLVFTALDDAACLYMFARHEGRKPRIPSRMTNLQLEYSKDKDIRRWMKRNSPGHWNSEDPRLLELGTLLEAAVRREAQKISEGVSADYDGPDKDTLIQAEMDIFYPSFLDKVVKKTDDGFMPNFRTIHKLVDDHRKLEQHGNKEVDLRKLTDTLYKFARERRRKFESFLHEHFGPVLGDQYFYPENGRRRKIPYELDNIVKEMKRTVRDGENWNYGAGSVRSLIAHQFRNYSGMEDEMHRLVSKEEFEPIKKGLDSEIMDLAGALEAKYRYQSNRFGYGDEFCEAVKAYVSRGQRGFREYFHPLEADQQRMLDTYVAKLKAAPTHYFEAKMRRSVEFSEFSGAVVPKGTRKETLLRLKSMGINKIVRYEPNNEQDRIRALNQFEGLMFGEGPEVEPAWLPTVEQDKTPGMAG